MKNKAKAIKVIKSDCKIKQQYMDKDGNTCAIGALALSVGVMFPDYNDALFPITGWRGNIECIDMGNSAFVIATRKALLDEFGLSTLDLCRIQKANDENDTPEDRQEVILKILEAL